MVEEVLNVKRIRVIGECGESERYIYNVGIECSVTELSEFIDNHRWAEDILIKNQIIDKMKKALDLPYIIHDYEYNKSTETTKEVEINVN